MEEDDAPEDGLVRMSGDTKARCCARISEQIEVDMFENFEKTTVVGAQFPSHGLLASQMDRR